MRIELRYMQNVCNQSCLVFLICKLSLHKFLTHKLIIKLLIIYLYFCIVPLSLLSPWRRFNLKSNSRFWVFGWLHLVSNHWRVEIESRIGLLSTNFPISRNGASVCFPGARKRELWQFLILCCEKPSAALDDWLIDKSPGAAPILTPYSSLARSPNKTQQNTHTHSPKQHFAFALFSFSLPALCFSIILFERSARQRKSGWLARHKLDCALFLLEGHVAYHFSYFPHKMHICQRGKLHMHAHYDMYQLGWKWCIFSFLVCGKKLLSRRCAGENQAIIWAQCSLGRRPKLITKSHPWCILSATQGHIWIQSCYFYGGVHFYILVTLLF